MRSWLMAASAIVLSGVGGHAASYYKIDEIIPMAGKSPSWDYVSIDSARQRLFVGRRAAGVTVYDLAARHVLTTIAHSEGANAAVLVPEFDRGYTINGDGTATQFNLSTLETISRLKIGESADNAFYDTATKTLIVTMGDQKLVGFLDAKTGKILGTLTLPAEEIEGAAADGYGHLFVAERDLNKIAKIDIASRKLSAEYDATGCEQPTGAAIDTANGRLFLGCKGEKPVLLVFDTQKGKVVTTVPIGRGNDGVVYDPKAHRVFATCGIDGDLVIYNQDSADSYALAQTLTTRPIARTIAMDPKSGKIFTASAEGAVDPTKKRNMRAGAFYPNTFFDDTFAVIVIKPPASNDHASAR